MKTNFLACVVMKERGMKLIESENKTMREHNLRMLMLDIESELINSELDPVNREEVVRNLLNNIEVNEVTKGVYIMKFIDLDMVDKFNIDEYIVIKRILTKLGLRRYIDEYHISKYLEEKIFAEGYVDEE